MALGRTVADDEPARHASVNSIGGLLLRTDNSTSPGPSLSLSPPAGRSADITLVYWFNTTDFLPAVTAAAAAAVER